MPEATILAALLLSLIALPALASCAYLLVLTLFSAQLPRVRYPPRRLKFDILVPAHNEAATIQRTVRSLLSLSWPVEAFRVLVIADNCSDDTAQLARAAGALVFERKDERLRGKGYALAYGFARSRGDRCACAVVVVDADSEASTNLLEACAARLEEGAEAVQVHYGVLNPDVSWRTRLITIAWSAFHIVRSRARERLGLSCGIRGNGWCLTHELLARVPYSAYSLAEDVEYGLQLGLAGVRVYYADEACVRGEMVSGEGAARSQRNRWEHGRRQLRRSHWRPLLKQGALRPSRICLDLAFDLLLPPLSSVALNLVLLLLLAVAATLWNPALAVFLWLGLVAAAVLVAHVLRGLALSGLGRRGLRDLLYAPPYMLWKLLLMRRRRDSGEWVRTKREGT